MELLVALLICNLGGYVNKKTIKAFKLGAKNIRKSFNILRLIRNNGRFRGFMEKKITKRQADQNMFDLGINVIEVDAS